MIRKYNKYELEPNEIKYNAIFKNFLTRSYLLPITNIIIPITTNLSSGKLYIN